MEKIKGELKNIHGCDVDAMEKNKNMIEIFKLEDWDQVRDYIDSEFELYEAETVLKALGNPMYSGPSEGKVRDAIERLK